MKVQRIFLVFVVCFLASFSYLDLSFSLSTKVPQHQLDNKTPSTACDDDNNSAIILQSHERWKSIEELGIRKKPNSSGGKPWLDEPTATTRSPQLKLNRSHYILAPGSWDGPPIVVPELKLLFFTVPKVGCAVFKQLFRRVAGISTWRSLGNNMTHNPLYNGLRYLGDFPLNRSLHMLTSPEWTRAIFLRDPKERVLSAYLDKAARKNASFVNRRCCRTRECPRKAGQSFEGFLQVAHSCSDPHWLPASKRMEGRYWPYVDFYGRLENANGDVRKLLESLGAWEKYGASGWSDDGTGEIFAPLKSIKHDTGASHKMQQYYTKETELMAEELYAEDYNNPLFGFNISSSRMYLTGGDCLPS